MARLTSLMLIVISARTAATPRQRMVSETKTRQAINLLRMLFYNLLRMLLYNQIPQNI